MTRNPNSERSRARAAYAALALCLCLALPSAALAGPPNHVRTPALDLLGAAPDPGSTHPAQPFNRACGTAVDSKGDVYVSSAGKDAIDVFNAAHEYLTTISNPNDPCALAVNSKGELFVSESATGNVVRYKPNTYPLSGTPTYGAAEAIDSSTEAEGIAVDRFDDRLYVAKGSRITVYKADGTPEPTSNEVQQVSVTRATGGTYTLIFRGQTTAPLAHNATSAQVDVALEALSTIGAGNVAVTAEPPEPEFVKHKVSFEGALQNKTVPQLRGDSSKLTGGGSGFGVNVTTLTQGFSGHVEGGLTDVTGVAAYTSKRTLGTDRYVYAADDGASDELKVFSGTDVRDLQLRTTIAGVDHDRNPETPDQSFGFGPAGAYLAADPGNRSAEDKCASVAEQACTAGHLLLYDDANGAVDEFEANGEFLDQIVNDAFEDAQPTAMAVERSGGPNDGTIYVSAGPGAGAKLLAFGPLAAPSRVPLPELSHVLATARSVATDRFGNVYAAAGSQIHVYSPSGEELTAFEDPHQPDDLAVDSACNVYVLEKQQLDPGPPPTLIPQKVIYYTPSACPPVPAATYTRHEPAVSTAAGSFGALQAIAINPGPSSGKDRLFVSGDFGDVGGGFSTIREYDSAANGSGLLNPYFGRSLGIQSTHTVGIYGRNGNVYVSGNMLPIRIVNSTGTEILAEINGAGSPKGNFTPNVRVAVDQSNGHALVFDYSMEAGREYDAAGAFVAEFGKFTNVSRETLIAIDNSCALRDPPLTEATTPTCKQKSPSSGNVYVAFDDPAPGSFDVTAFDSLEYGEASLAETGIADGIEAGEAILNGTVNPRGFELSECKFEYLSGSEYLANGETFGGATSVPCAETPLEIGKRSEPVAVHADLTGLDPEGRYRFRLLAKNKYGESEGDPWLFGPPEVSAKSALPILYDETTLRAGLDPSGLETEYRFEYRLGAGEFDQATPWVKLAPGDGPVAIEAPLTGLEEGAEYRFRIFAKNEAKEVSGPDQVFTTLQRRAAEDCPNGEFRTGLSANLPDCRAYELVTPAETNGLSPYAGTHPSAGDTFNNWLATPRGPQAGEVLTYFTDGTLPGFDGSGRFDGYRARRGAGIHPVAGWRSELFGPTFVEGGPGLFRLSLQEGVSQDQLYSFWNIDPEEFHAGTLPKGTYLRGPTRFEPLGQGSLATDLEATSDFVNAGGTHVLFSSDAHLEPEAAPSGTMALYDRAAGASSAEVVSLKPDGSSLAAGEGATFVANNEEGSAVLFKVGGTLYLHKAGQSTEIAPAPNTFAGVSEDGRRVFYVAASDGTSPATLFACDLQAGPCVGSEASGRTQIAANSIFVNVSLDGSQVFFTSDDALTGAEESEAGEVAEAGKHNLYAWNSETEATSFVAQLDLQDFVNNPPTGTTEGFAGIARMNLQSWTTAINPGVWGRALSPTRATLDGDVFLFQSHARLTAYDNTEATADACGDPEVAEEPCGEIYRYQPVAPADERLLCVSCDPSGAPPSSDAMLQDTQSLVTGVNATTLIANVTDDGEEVFFQSSDRLLPEDANDAVDVYEWQASSAEGCKRPGGCLALISSGQGEHPNFLYAMSADGRDVFFRTREKLVGADIPGSPSLYDARVGGGIPNPPGKEPCQGDSCQGQASTPPALPAPASTAPSGPEEAKVGKPRRRCPKGERRVSRRGKARCVKRAKKQAPKRQSRVNRDRRARR